MPANGFRLITLGRLALVRPDGAEEASLGTRRRKLALLAVLAFATRPVERDFLLDMFWGEQDEERARHALSDALSHLRRVLGHESIAARRTDVSLSEATRLCVDALELRAAATAKDWHRVTTLYGGPFLEFVYVDNSPRFEQWADRERDRLRTLFVGASAQQCLALARARDWAGCAELARRWLDAEPLSADAALYLLNALKAPDTAAGYGQALAAYEQLTARIGREYQASPDRAVSGLAADIARRLAERDAESAAVIDGGGETAAAPASSGSPSPAGVLPAASVPVAALTPAQPLPSRARRRIATWAGLAGLAVAVTGAAAFARFRDRGVEPPAKPVIAIIGIRNVTGDTSAAWLGAGLPEMIVADLSRSSAVDVVDPGRVVQLIARAGVGRVSDLPLATTLDLGRRVGATWAVDGTLSRTDGRFILEFNVRDVASGTLVHPYVVRDADVMALADHAAARLLGAADASGPGPRLAEVETPSLEAYQHYVRAVQAGDDGREADERREVDAAVALDSGFVAALRMRIDLATSTEADQETVPRLSAAFERAAPRASEHDRIEQSVQVALRNGERTRSEALARLLVQRYPRDPHSYALLATIYDIHGMWLAADTVMMQELELDSLGTEAGVGPCAPCVAYSGLIGNRASYGDLRGAEQAANRWIALQPDLPAAWAALSSTLSFEHRFDEALRSGRRAAALAGNDPESQARIARILIMARRWSEADSVITAWSRSPSRRLWADAVDLRMVLQRERGEFRAAIRTADAFHGTAREAEALQFMKESSLGVLGDYAGVVRVHETIARGNPAPGAAVSPASTLVGDWARTFCWQHALEADALAGSGDTLRLRVLADSINQISARSYYGSDWRLAHHVRGLIAMRAHRYADAEREFQAARWGVAGWTRTVAELAQAQSALGRPLDAIATLREAYLGPLDAMGRYEPHTHIDFLMAKSFQQAGMADSEAVYAGYVRTAWKDADPEVKRLLAQLP